MDTHEPGYRFFVEKKQHLAEIYVPFASLCADSFCGSGHFSPPALVITRNLPWSAADIHRPTLGAQSAPFASSGHMCGLLHLLASPGATIRDTFKLPSNKSSCRRTLVAWGGNNCRSPPLFILRGDITSVCSSSHSSWSTLKLQHAARFSDSRCSIHHDESSTHIFASKHAPKPWSFYRASRRLTRLRKHY